MNKYQREKAKIKKAKIKKKKDEIDEINLFLKNNKEFTKNLEQICETHLIKPFRDFLKSFEKALSEATKIISDELNK